MNYFSTLILLLALSLCYCVPSDASVPEEKPVAIGSIKWAVYDTALSRPLDVGEKSLQASDVKIRRIGKTMCDKKIELGGHFSFGLADDIDREREAVSHVNPDCQKIDEDGYVITQEKEVGTGGRQTHCGGFGLTGDRDDVQTFSWDWFEVDRPGHATKLQESGELSFDTKKNSTGTEINRMVFLTDVSLRVSRMSDANPLKPAWRIKIFKGSCICWPSSDVNTVRKDIDK